MGNIREDAREKVYKQLEWDNRIEAKDLEVDLMDGRLTLRGSVPSYDAMRAAEESAYVIPGIQAVDNSMIIQYPDDITVPTDEDIRSTIEMSLKWNNNLSSNTISLEVNDGEVKLNGIVDKYWKKRLAEDIAYTTTGVKSVDNHIETKQTEEVLDDVIARDVKAAIDRNYQVDAEMVEVAVENGLVTLSGTVPDFNASRAAYVSAIYTNGVNEVRNHITIKNL